jgi:Iap family predicted aminopeptidase
MRPRDGLVVALLMVASVPLTGLHVRSGAAEAVRDIARSSITGGQSLTYASELTMMGPRLTGSRSYQHAAAWCIDRFRAMGIAATALEPFAIERGWERVSARGRIVEPASRELHVASLGWTPSTPEGGLEADVVGLESFSLAAIAANRSLRGRIAMLPDGEPPGDPDAAARALGEALRAAGVVAILAPDGDPDNELVARGFGYGTVIGKLPAAQIGRDDAQAIRGLLNRGRVRLSLELVNRVTDGAVTVNNVLADIPGRERPDEWVIVGAHLDSWDFGTGAQDNATGVAMVLEAARAIGGLEERPRRSIRFALWGGEEQGQLGSTAYVRAHAAELDRAVAMLNADAGTGRMIGWTSPGREDTVRAVRTLAGSVLDEIGAGTFDESLRYAFQSDGAPFVLAGIPMLDLNADDTRYEDIHHKAADTMERVDARQLAVGAAAVAATAYAIADAPLRIAPRLDRRAVERLRKKGP